MHNHTNILHKDRKLLFIPVVDEAKPVEPFSNEQNAAAAVRREAIFMGASPEVSGGEKKILFTNF